MQSQSTPIKKNQLVLSVSPLLNSEEYSKKCCLKDISECGPFKRPRNTITTMSKIAELNMDISSHIKSLKLDTNIMNDDIINEKSLIIHR